MAISRINSRAILDGSVVAAEVADGAITPAKLQTGVDFTVNGLTVGKGGGSVATTTTLGYQVMGINTGANNTGVGYQALGNNTSGASNTGIGHSALNQNSTASNNTAVGYQAGYSNSTGTEVAAFGYQAMYSQTTGARNSAFGIQAMYANTTGTDNAAFGRVALTANTTGSGNNAFGSAAMYSNTTGTINQAFGDGALFSNVSGSRNVAIGGSALYANTASDNVGVGYFALKLNTSGASNVAMGREALYSNTTASENTALGYQAAYSNVTGTGITAVGKGAAYATTGNYNTILGWRSGEAMTSGTGNTFVGALAGLLSTGSSNVFVGGPISGVSNGCASAMTTGSKNVIIGNHTGNGGGLDIRASSNQMVLSDGDGNIRQYIDGNGNVYIGTYPPKYASGSGRFTVSQLTNAWDTNSYGNILIDCQTAYNSNPAPGIVFGIPYSSTQSAVGVSLQGYKVNATSGDFGQGFRISTQGNGAAPSIKFTIDGSGNIGNNYGSNIYNASDRRLKKNIVTLDNALDKVNALNGVSFNWIDNFCEGENDKTLYGFIAQEVETVDENLIDPFGPEEIKVDDLTVTNPIRVNEKFILPLLVNAIKELKAEFDEYKRTHP
jgi:hypothetical protein